MQILQNKTHFGIYGIRFLDRDHAVIVQEIWFKSANSNEASWEKLEVPEGREIIGVHGYHDETYIRGIGL